MNKPHRIIYMGTPEVAVPALNALHESPEFDIISVITQPDKKVGRKQVITPSPIKEWALTKQIPVLQPPTVKHNPEFLDLIKGLNPDLLVVTAYGQILPPEMLEVPTYGSVNLHFSLLPKYRGASPVESAILNGDAETGITYQLIGEKLDAGPIIHIEKLLIDKRDTTSTLKDKLSQITAVITPTILSEYLSGILKPVPQDESNATKCSKISKEDGIIDPFSMDAETICRKVRAYDIWPGCFMQMKTKRLKLIEVACGKDLPELDAGTFSIMNNKRMMVGAIQGTLEILKLQLEGKKEMNTQDFLAGNLNLLKNELATDK